ncbi:MAG: crotonase/enoyl-CoA hydratase family protein [bacterium]|nr:crotonase/enoyl-CoA hydratase family protein [bacterium]
MSDRVSIQISDGVADVRLNRPEKMNAIDAAMFSELIAAGRSLAEDSSLRAIVLSGEGRAFCAGLDFSSFSAMDKGADSGESKPGSRDEAGASRIPTRGQEAAWVWQQCPVPVIAAVHGVAFGGGCQIALGADIRFIAPDARMSIMEIKWGLVPDMAGTQTLRRLARLDVIKELAFTGRQISGEQAVELGLATHLSNNPLEDASALAREIAGKNPHAIRSMKQLMNASGIGSEQEGLALEWDLQSKLIGSPNQVEAVRANMEKRAPSFKDPA